jgi:Family of unknown function (DUF6515)
MESNLPRMARTALAALAAMVLFTPLVQAQERRVMREHERERFHTPHWVLDDRFHHNHYYPAPGYSVGVLPAGNIAVGFRGNRYWFHSGVWFRQSGPGYVVVRPPAGVFVPLLPPAYTMVYFGDVPYYYANDVYYVQQPGGYAVAEPPMVVAAPEQAAPPPPPQPGAAPAGAPPAVGGTWYYCESSRGYYPYVTECGEGWKAVPAAPPPAR